MKTKINSCEYADDDSIVTQSVMTQHLQSWGDAGARTDEKHAFPRVGCVFEIANGTAELQLK